MATNVRLFTAVVAVSIGALAFKGVDIAQAVAQAAGEAPKTPPETALTAGVGARPAAATPAAGADPAPAPASEAPPADAAKADSCVPSLDAAAADMGVSSQEILVLRSLQGRRKELDDRETAVQTREQAAAAAESRLQDQIGDLKKVETSVKALLAKMDQKADERMTILVKTYETMKPKDAAGIFNGLDDQLLLDVAKSMKPATLAPVMSLMQSKRAETLTKMLADLAKPPAGLDSLPKSPT
jgi:flagellar motility protein MotE (MotC chaperone)